MAYQVVMDGWLDRGDYIPPGAIVEKWRLPEIPNLDALVEEGVLKVVDDAPVVDDKVAFEFDDDGQMDADMGGSDG